MILHVTWLTMLTEEQESAACWHDECPVSLEACLPGLVSDA